MMASLEHAVSRTLTVFDQLGVMWGPEARADVSVHRLTHDQVHAIGGPESAYEVTVERPAFICTRVETPLGFSVSFFGTPHGTCARCRELLGLPRLEVEAAQIAGIVERLEGSGV